MFYYIRHFLLSEKLYAIFLWHGKNDRTFRPEKSMRRECYSPVDLIRFFIGSAPLFKPKVSSHAQNRNR